MKTSTLLKRAEDYLWDGIEQSPNNAHDPYRFTTLYGAIKAASDNQGFRAKVACGNAQHAIAKALDGCTYYTTWAVRDGHLPKHWVMDHKKWYPILQANRLNWLRELQRQFKEQGD